MRWFHWHRWVKTKDEAWGNYYKTSDDQSVGMVVVRGYIESCACGEQRLVPFNKDLKPTHVVPQ